MSDEPMRLLIVDDDEADRVAIRRALQGAALAAEIDEERGGDSAIARMSASVYDCVILDQSTHDEDGQSLIRRAREAGISTPILVVTGQDDDAAARLVAAGASDYLPKADLSPSRLVRRMRYAMRVGRAEARAHEAVHELAAERTLFAAVLRQMPAAVMVAAVPSGKLLLSNDQVADLLGQPTVLKESLEQLGKFPAFRADGTAYRPEDWPIARAVARGETIAAEEMILERPDGARSIVRASAQPVHDAQNRSVAAVMTLEDLSSERDAQGELERAAHAREEILAIVSHDLRNPLNAVSVAIDELADPDLEASTRLRYVTAIRRAVGRADRLIRDLLDVSRIEAGKLSIDARPVAARALLEQAAREHEVLARDAGMGIKVSVDGALADAKILADRDRVLQAVGNLIGNALRYARGKGDVDLSLERDARDGKKVRIWVSDKGPGIPADALPHIFDHYWQANRQRRAGAGLGLSIVQGIAVAHGGSIHAENRDGGGARFCLSLPAVPQVSDGR